MNKMIKVGMADLKSCKSPEILTTLGLGSCVGIVLHDPVTRVSGLAHVMLPDSTQIRNNNNVAKFADTAIDKLIGDMIALGANRKRLVAKIAGGAQMFSFDRANEMMSIGERNAKATKVKLKALDIRVLAEDTGANYGRTIEFYSETGDLLIKTIGREPKTV